MADEKQEFDLVELARKALNTSCMDAIRNHEWIASHRGKIDDADLEAELGRASKRYAAAVLRCERFNEIYGNGV